jgi:glyoxylase-like metal-dependent hydrolase (beta-lactamase superfamily II)
LVVAISIGHLLTVGYGHADASDRKRRMSYEPIDLLHGAERVVATYLVETDDGLALVDCGPASSLPALESGLAVRGLSLSDVRHLLLTHIHLDHAGATGVLVRRQPALQVHVSEIGAPHLVDPSRLEASARRLFGDDFDTLWGEVAPVPEENIRLVSDRVVGLDCFPSQGHARHHVSYLHPDGTLFAGDSAGVRISPARFVLAPTPPPEVDLEAWESTISETERRGPARLALTHFGVFEDVGEHLAGLRETLRTWSDRVSHGMDEPTFVAAGLADCADSDPDEVHAYGSAASFSQCHQGLERYWHKRRELAAP